MTPKEIQQALAQKEPELIAEAVYMANRQNLLDLVPSIMPLLQHQHHHVRGRTAIYLLNFKFEGKYVLQVLDQLEKEEHFRSVIDMLGALRSHLFFEGSHKELIQSKIKQFITRISDQQALDSAYAVLAVSQNKSLHLKFLSYWKDKVDWKRLDFDPDQPVQDPKNLKFL